MPLHVDIRVNDLLINTLHIGRISGGTGSDNINTYMVVEGERPQSIEDWIDGVEYNHRYGDGAEVCVIKALQALGYDGEQITRS
jgi:hypothetical protein